MSSAPIFRPLTLLSLAALTTSLACSAASNTNEPPFDGAIAIGTWGGDSGGLIVGDTAAHLHIGCTFGDVSGRIPIRADGTFDVAGSYMLRAYPVAFGPTVPARFTGRVDGSTVTITATVNDTVQKTTVVRGPVVLKFGADPKLGPCPICRNPYAMSRRSSSSLAPRSGRSTAPRPPSAADAPIPGPASRAPL